VESLITLNSRVLSAVPWLKSIRSQSVTGLSSIVLVFERGTDLMKAADDPGAADAGLHAAETSRSRRSSSNRSPRQPRDDVGFRPTRSSDGAVAARPLDDQAAAGRRPGVANVAIWGQRLRQLQVQVDPDRYATRA